ncbi:MAG: hypothetical protein DRQ02_09305 [Candidatus Latescibacterota bacterium]|nr:MAG: hypothetical protein DRQ02_09305 [Candidatus Latescibacterota bacterium]
MNYLLDTHSLIWYFMGSRRLRPRAREAIDECRTMGGKLLVPTIVLSEALDIAEKGKVEFDFQSMYRLIRDDPSFEIVGFTPEIFDETVKAREIKEIHDRIILATARFYGAGIISKDRVIKNSGEVALLEP